MVAIRRRAFMLIAATLAACGAKTPTPAQVVADLTGIVGTLKLDFPLIVKLAPKALTADQQTEIGDDITKSKEALVNIVAGMPADAGAPIAQQIDMWINDVMNTLVPLAAMIPGAQAYAVALAAIDAILPDVESFVNQYIPSAVKMSKVFGRASRVKLAPDAARKLLGIPVVHP